MSTQRKRYLAVVTGGPVDVIGDYAFFKARDEEFDDRISEAISEKWGILDEGSHILIARYTELKLVSVAETTPKVWDHKFKTLPKPGGSK